MAGLAVAVVQLHGAAGRGVRRKAGVAEGDLLGPGLADVGRRGGRRALGGGRDAVGLLLKFHYAAVRGVDLIVVLIPAGEKLQLVDQDAVVVVPLPLIAGHTVRRHAGVAEGNLFGPGLADVPGAGGGGRLLGFSGSVSGGRPGGRASRRRLFLKLHHPAISGADFIVVRIPAGGKPHLVDRHAVFIVPLCRKRGGGLSRHARMGVGDLPGLCLADVPALRHRGLHLRRRDSLLRVPAELHNAAGGGADHVVVGNAVRREFHLVDRSSALLVPGNLVAGEIAFSNPGMAQSGRLRRLLPHVPAGPRGPAQPICPGNHRQRQQAAGGDEPIASPVLPVLFRHDHPSGSQS